MYIYNRKCRFLENRLHPKAKWFDGFFFLFILLFVFAVEDAVLAGLDGQDFSFV